MDSHVSFLHFHLFIFHVSISTHHDRYLSSYPLSYTYLHLHSSTTSLHESLDLPSEEEHTYSKIF